MCRSLGPNTALSQAGALWSLSRTTRFNHSCTLLFPPASPLALQIATDLSPTNQFSTLVPFLVVLAISILKEGLEDRRRYIADAVVNKSTVKVLRGEKWVEIHCQDVALGDFVLLEDGDEVPADMALISAHAAQGGVHVDVSSLSGDMSLSMMQPLRALQGFGRDERALAGMRAAASLTEPSADIFQPSGTLEVWPDGKAPSVSLRREMESTPRIPHTSGRRSSAIAVSAADGSARGRTVGGISAMSNGASATIPSAAVVLAGRTVTGVDVGSEGQAVLPLSPESVALRGMRVKHTEWAVGLVTRVGKDTAMLRSSLHTHLKRSSLDSEINGALWLLFALLLLFVAGTVAFHSNWQRQNAGHKQYLTFLGSLTGAADVSRSFVTFMLLYNNVIPISLYVTLEVVRWCQARSVEADPALSELPDGSCGGQAPQVRSSSLNEDLGMVDYVFADKTGTLTSAQMDCRAVAIGGITFGCVPSDSDDPTQPVLSRSAPSRRASRPTSRPTTDEGTEPSSDLRTARAAAMFGASSTPRRDSAAGGNAGVVDPVAAAVTGLGAVSDVPETAEEAMEALRQAVAAAQEHEDDEDENGLGEAPEVGITVAESVPGTPFADSRLLAVVLAAVRLRRLAAKLPPTEAAAFSLPPLAVRVLEFWYAVTLCHSVERVAGTDGTTEYNSASPDEQALVLAGRAMGFGFVRRNGSDVILSIDGEEECWTVVAVHPFTPMRKRMSVLVRCAADGRAAVYSKGADSVMKPRLFNSDMAGSRAPRPSRTMVAQPSDPGLEPLGGLTSFQPAFAQFGSVASTGAGAGGTDFAASAGSMYNGSELGDSSPIPASSAAVVAAGSGNESTSDFGSMMRPASAPERPGPAPTLASGKLDCSSQATVDIEAKSSHFGVAGFRTLVVAGRELSGAELDAVDALSAGDGTGTGHGLGSLMTPPRSSLAELLEHAETHLIPLGVTGVETQLVEGTPETISTLRRAGCKVWMVTGDKEETAVAVAQSAGFIESGSTVVVLNGRTMDECDRQMSNARAELRSKAMWHPRVTNNKLALVINGEALSNIIAASPEARRLEHERRARAVRRERAATTLLAPSSADIGDDDGDDDDDGSARGSRPGFGQHSRGFPLCCFAGGSRRRGNIAGGSGGGRVPKGWGHASPGSNQAYYGQGAHGDEDECTDPACVGSCFCGVQGCLCCCCSSVAPAVMQIATLRQSSNAGSAAGISHGIRAAGSPMRAESFASTAGSAGSPQSAACCTCCNRTFLCCGGLTATEATMLSNAGIAPGTFSWWLLHPSAWFPVWLTAALGISDISLETEPLTRERRLLELFKQCRSVIACGMSPMQKAQLVRMVNTMIRPAPVTLAIGDGANDAAMLQTASVGVGILGSKHQHAVRSSDVAIDSFRHLSRLLLVHGRRNYRRTGLTILYSLFKNVVLVFTLVLFSFTSGFSGNTIYESYLGAGWNVGWTFLPILAVGIVDADISANAALRYPFIYRHGLKLEGFSYRALAGWIIDAILFGGAVAAAAFAVIGGSGGTPGRADGLDTGVWLDGTMINFCLVVLVNGKLMLHMNTWSLLTIGSILLSLGLWFGFVALYAALYTATGESVLRDFSGISDQFFPMALPWFCMLLFVAAILTINAAAVMWHRQSNPSAADIVQEWDRGLGEPLTENYAASLVAAQQRRTMERHKRRARRKNGAEYLLLQESPWALSEQEEAEMELEAMAGLRIGRSKGDIEGKSKKLTIIGSLGGASAGRSATSVSGGELLDEHEHVRQTRVLERLAANVVASQELLWRDLHKRYIKHKERISKRRAARQQGLGSTRVGMVVPVKPGAVAPMPKASESMISAEVSDAEAATDSPGGLAIPGWLAKHRFAFEANEPGEASEAGSAGGGGTTVTSQTGPNWAAAAGAAGGGPPTSPPGPDQSGRSGRRGSVAVAPVWMAGSNREMMTKAENVGGDTFREAMSRLKQSSAGTQESLSLVLEDSETPRLTRFTRQFADDPDLERSYHSTFFLGKSLPVTRSAFTVAAVLGGAFVIFEYVASLEGIGGFAKRPPEAALLTFLGRAALVLGAVVVSLMSYLSCFRRSHDLIMFAILLITGILKTILVSDAGTFGQALYIIAVLLILRLSFASAVVLAVLDFLIFVAAIGLQLIGVGRETLVTYVPFAFFVLAFSVYGALSIDDAMRQDFLQQARLSAEKSGFQAILSSSMPKHVTKKLRRLDTGGFTGLYFEHEPEITVIFIDVADFDKVTSTHTPQMMVTLLDRLWRLFDALVEKHLVTKMETVGKTYMACAGLQGSRPDHAAAIVMLGLDVVHTLSKFRDCTGHRIINVKIGVHTGPVVSGVAGLKKQQFSLFGDTVNTSARMQSSGDKNRVHVSPTTYEHIDGLFHTEARQTPVKSKGIMTTHHIGQPIVSKAAAVRRASLLAGRRAPPLATGGVTAAGHAVTAAWGTTDDHSTPATADGKGTAVLPPSASVASSPGTIVTAHRGVTWAATTPAAPAAGQGTMTPKGGLARLKLTGVARPDSSSQHFESPTSLAGDGQTAAQKEASASRDNAFRIATPRYVFADPKLEALYQVKGRRGHLKSIRLAGFMLGLFMLFRVLWEDTATESSRILRVACAVLVCVPSGATAFPLFRHADAATRHVVMTLVYAGAGTLMVAANRFSAEMALDVLFFTALTANSGSVQFLGSFAANLVTSVVGIVFASLRLMDFGLEPPVSASTIFFICVGLVAGILSAASRAYYKRRRFGLEMMTKDETSRTHGILYNMLPAALVNQIREGKQGVSDTFNHVTLLFCDIQGFTRMAGSLQPEQVVRMLDQLFCSCDTITDRYGAFKVQTIGDAYVMVAGMPFLDKRVDVSRGRVAAALDAKASSRQMTASSKGLSSPGVRPMLQQKQQHGSKSSMASSVFGNALNNIFDIGRFASSTESDDSLADGDTISGGASKHFVNAGDSVTASTGRSATVSIGVVAPPPNDDLLSTSRRELPKPSQHMELEELDSKNATSAGHHSVTVKARSDAPEVEVEDVEEGFSWLPEEQEAIDAAKARGMDNAEYLARHFKRRGTARTMVDVAMDMLDAIQNIKHPGTSKPIVMRIGLHTGNIVGGVIGSKTLRYDIWGTDVLVGNKMESEGIPGGLVVSEDTRLSLLGEEDLEFRPHRLVSAKGRGDVMTFQVIKTVTNSDGTIRKVGDVEIEGDGHGGELEALAAQAALLQSQTAGGGAAVVRTPAAKAGGLARSPADVTPAY